MGKRRVTLPPGTRRVALALLVGAALGGSTASVVSGQAAPTPTLTVEPPGGGPGDVVTLTITGCDASTPAFLAFDSSHLDVLSTTPIPVAETAPDVWTGTFELRAHDDTFIAGCGTPTAGGPVTSVDYDVEAPRLTLVGDGMPIGTFEPRLDHVVGTDCPAGGQAEVTFVMSGGLRSVVTATPDADGTFEASAPPNRPRAGITVSATCGGITYPSERWYGGADLTATTTTTSTAVSTTTATPATAGAATGASSVPGRADFTG